MSISYRELKDLSGLFYSDLAGENSNKVIKYILESENDDFVKKNMIHQFIFNWLNVGQILEML